MPQQINLMHAGLVRRREPFGSRDAGLWVFGAMALVAVAAFGLHRWAERDAGRADHVEQQLAALQARAAAAGATPPGPSRSAIELERLRTLEAGQRRVLAAIDSGSAGRTEGYAEYFMALSRQARPDLWITGLSVAADGASLELQGRMSDPKTLADYLRRLNGEALFRGRDFAQLSLKAVAGAAEGGVGITEFSLRSGTPGGEATK